MTDSEREEVRKIVNRLALPDSDRAELVEIIERLARPEAREAMVNVKKQMNAFWAAMSKNGGGKRDGYTQGNAPNGSHGNTA